MIFEIRVDMGQIWGVFPLLVLFGIAFNSAITYLERKGYLEGFVSLAVATGVGATLLPFLVVSPDFTLLVMLGFVASGVPMIAGSIYRYVRSRREAIQLDQEIANGDKTTRLA